MMKQQDIFNRLYKAWQQQTLSHAYLFYGATGVGKKEMAEWLAKTLFCQTPTDVGACQHCVNCQRITAGEFSDVQWVEPDGATIKVEQIRQLKENVSYSSLEHGKKVYIINQADKMTLNAANGLLKFLEEPEMDVYFMLLTTQKDNILDTIQSRCQLIRFPHLKADVLAELLIDDVPQETMRSVLVGLTQDVEHIKQLAQSEEFQQFYTALIQFIQCVCQKDSQAFISIQTKLLPFITNKEWAAYGLDIIALYLRDVLMVQRNQLEDIFFKNQITVMQKVNSPVMSLLKACLTAKDRLNHFVTPQVCYEALCLEVLE